MGESAKAIDHSIEYEKPITFIAGPSGSGKSTALRNLDPERTIILNSEQKALPFQSARKFKRTRSITGIQHFYDSFTAACDADADVIVVDSFTALAEFVYTDYVRPVEKVGDNVMAAWSTYKDTIGDILTMAKSAKQYVVFTGLSDTIQDDQMRQTRTIAVQGSWKGKVSKEFTICVHTKVIPADPLNGGEPEYVFVTNSDGIHQAKSPMSMLPLHMPNDVALLISLAHNYYTEE